MGQNSYHRCVVSSDTKSWTQSSLWLSPVVANMPANAGNTGSVPDSTCLLATKPGRHNNWACVLQATEAGVSRTHDLQQMKPPRWEVHTQQLESGPPNPASTPTIPN